MVDTALAHMLDADGRMICQSCIEWTAWADLAPVEGEPGRVWDICKWCQEAEPYPRPGGGFACRVRRYDDVTSCCNSGHNTAREAARHRLDQMRAGRWDNYGRRYLPTPLQGSSCNCE